MIGPAFQSEGDALITPNTLSVGHSKVGNWLYVALYRSFQPAIWKLAGLGICSLLAASPCKAQPPQGRHLPRPGRAEPDYRLGSD